MINQNTPNKLPSAVKWHILTELILIIFALSLPFSLFNRGVWFLVFCLCFIFIGLPVFIYFLLYFNSLTFVVENDKITINSGVIVKRSNSISFNRVQNVENIRGVLARLFGLSKVSIWTSSPEQIKVYRKETIHKPAGSLELTVADGEWLKSFILSKHS